VASELRCPSRKLKIRKHLTEPNIKFAKREDEKGGWCLQGKSPALGEVGPSGRKGKTAHRGNAHASNDKIPPVRE